MSIITAVILFLALCGFCLWLLWRSYERVSRIRYVEMDVDKWLGAEEEYRRAKELLGKTINREG